VLDRNCPLCSAAERRYAYFLPVTPHVEECLLHPVEESGRHDLGDRPVTCEV
jgi:hypothetical protein